jgi:hypothetical protein
MVDIVGTKIVEAAASPFTGERPIRYEPVVDYTAGIWLGA